MAIRLTQYYIDVGGLVTSGKLRVTRQYVDVLVSVTARVDASISSNIVFVSTAITGQAIDQDVFQFLYLGSDARIQTTYSVSVLSTLTFTHHLNRVITESASNVVYFIDYSLIDYSEHRDVVEHIISFTDSLSIEGFKGVPQDLGITDSVNVKGPVFVSALSSLFFTSDPSNLNKYEIVGDRIVLDSYAQVTMPHHASNTLVFTQLVQFESFYDILTLIDSVDVGKSKAYKATITFVDSAIQSGGTFRRSILNTLGVDHHLTYYEDAACLRKQYTPFSGEGAKVANSIPNPQFITRSEEHTSELQSH